MLNYMVTRTYPWSLSPLQPQMFPTFTDSLLQNTFLAWNLFCHFSFTTKSEYLQVLGYKNYEFPYVSLIFFFLNFLFILNISPSLSTKPIVLWWFYLSYQVGMPGNEQFIPTVNFTRQSFPSYSWLPGTQRNFGTCAPVIIHPSGIPSPKSFPHSLSH